MLHNPELHMQLHKKRPEKELECEETRELSQASDSERMHRLALRHVSGKVAFAKWEAMEEHNEVEEFENCKHGVLKCIRSV